MTTGRMVMMRSIGYYKRDERKKKRKKKTMIPPKRFDVFFPLTEGCSEGLDAFIFFFKKILYRY